jgi:hypothetical protein
MKQLLTTISMMACVFTIHAQMNSSDSTTTPATDTNQQQVIEESTQSEQQVIEEPTKEPTPATVTTQTPEPAAKEPKQKKGGGFSIKKMTFGINGGLSVGDYTSIYIAPRIGYYFTPSTILGTQFIYRYNSQKTSYGGDRVTSHSYGTGLWARQFLLKKFFLHAEWETLNMPFYTQKNTEIEEEREWVNSILLGAGYYKRLGKKAGVGFSVLYIVNYDDDRNSYGSPWVVRVGAYF